MYTYDFHNEKYVHTTCQLINHVGNWAYGLGEVLKIVNSFGHHLVKKIVQYLHDDRRLYGQHAHYARGPFGGEMPPTPTAPPPTCEGAVPAAIKAFAPPPPPAGP